MEYFFGAGSLFGRQTGVNNPTPIRFGALQNASVDFAFTNKPLFGQYQFPVDVARGTSKVSGKATFAQLNGATFNNLFFGETAALGTSPVFTAIDEQQNVAANAATVTNNATYNEDLGVINLTTGLLMTRVASLPVGTANYAVNESTGVYTFNSAMNGVIVAISYDYTLAAGGSQLTMVNQLTGSGPQFLLVLSGSLKGKAMRLKLNAVMSSKLSLGTKLEDYMMPDFEFDAFVDTAGNLGSFNFAE